MHRFACRGAFLWDEGVNYWINAVLLMRNSLAFARSLQQHCVPHCTLFNSLLGQGRQRCVQALPREQAVRDAALKAVETALAAPWALSDNFLACTKKDTQKMFLTISGAGLDSGAQRYFVLCDVARSG